jgi:hypothetical protein
VDEKPVDTVDKVVYNTILVAFGLWKLINGKKNLKTVDNVEMQTKALVFKGISVDKFVDSVDRTYVFKIVGMD